jgi:hypothetical protein
MDEERTANEQEHGYRADGRKHVHSQDGVEKRSVTAGAMQMAAQAAELAEAGLIGGATWEAGRRLVGQAFDRPSNPEPPKIEVEEVYRPKDDSTSGK